ncbi:uncharacterized protein LOC122700586 isoform X2 [Cervus elaphus]|nr:uncharacterized protein LOC122700586 isoform X2 [Cervus elaphus]
MAPRKGRGPDAQEFTGVVPDLPSQPRSREPLDTARERIFRLGRKFCSAGQEVPPLCRTPATPRHAEVRRRRTSSIATSVGARLEAGGGADLESARGAGAGAAQGPHLRIRLCKLPFIWRTGHKLKGCFRMLKKRTVITEQG